MTRQEILDSAAKCVCGDRDQQYGSSENSFRMIDGSVQDRADCYWKLQGGFMDLRGGEIAEGSK